MSAGCTMGDELYRSLVLALKDRLVTLVHANQIPLPTL